MQIDQNVSK